MDVDATYAYVVDDPTEHVYVYQLSDGARQTGKEFAIHSTNTWPVGLGVTATDAYVADRTSAKMFVYQLSDGARQTSLEFDFHSTNARPRGAAVDGTYAYVVDDAANRVYVYQLSDGARQAGREFALHSANENAHGISVNATYAYVVDDRDDHVYVYRLSDGARIKDLEFGLDSDNKDAAGIGVNATFAYVADIADLKVYTYLLSRLDVNLDLQATGRDAGSLDMVTSSSPVPLTSTDDFKFENDGNTFLLVQRGSTAITMTVVLPGTVDGLGIEDRSEALAQGIFLYGPYAPAYYSDAGGKTGGKVSLTFSAVTDLSIAVIRLTAPSA